MLIDLHKHLEYLCNVTSLKYQSGYSTETGEVETGKHFGWRC